MRRNLRIDILMMLLFLIFGGALDAQQTSLRGKDEGEKVKNPIFSGSDAKGDGGGGDYSCAKEDENGQFCFTKSVKFVNLEFEINTETGKREAILPCDLHVGVSIEGLDETTFISLSENIYYQYFDEQFSEEYSQSFFLGAIEICFDANVIYGLLNYDTSIECPEDAPAVILSKIGDISISFDIYCSGPLGGMIPVDNCSGFEFLEDYIYGGGLYGYDDCSFEFVVDYKICCKNFKKPLDESGEIKPRVSFQGSEIKVVGSILNDILYKIYTINGVLKSSGKFDDTITSHHIIQDQNLENGIYILVLTSDGTQSSHKFVSFR